ncbi:MAG: choice-of-anchor D domain-containing protein [Ignavibacteria bacterium]|nr:choice-of-anchor D domain-containing protein [Ignavibacteria bacterium]
MKKIYITLISVITFGILFATTFHTINIDGVNDFHSDESFSTSTAGYNAYVTWDANNIYLGYSGFDIGSGQSSTKWIVFYFDTDANLNPLSGNGTPNAIGFNTQNWILPFRADYMIQIRTNGGFEALKRFTGTAWVDVTPHNMQIFDNNASNYIEIRIPRASLNNPTKIYLVGYFINELSGFEWTYASFPDNSLRNGDGYKNPGYFDHWYGFELINGISPNAPQNYDNREFLKWDIRLGASISSLGLNDNNNYAGMALNATDGYDANVDLEKPPAPPSNFVYLAFPHNDWTNPLGPFYYRDIKANRLLDTSTVAWDFIVSTDRTNSTVTISATEFSDVPSNYDIYINDLTNNILHNVRTQGNYSFNSGSGGTRNFKLVVGKYVPNIVAASSVNFGNVKLEYDSIRTLRVDNTGLVTLTISNLSITGNYSLVGATTPINIPAGGFVNLTIRFSPKQLGSNSGTLTITSNDPDTPNLTVTLIGNGIRPTVTKKFLPGWNLIGLPLYPSNPLKDSVFSQFSSNYVLFKYQTGSYVNADSVLIGRAYWLGLNDTMNFSITGMPVLNDTIIPLESGWNLISLLYLRDLRKAQLQIKKGNETISLDSAVSRGWVQGNLFAYSKPNNSYQLIDTLDQFIGYWFATLTTGVELRFVKSQTFGTLPKIQNDFQNERNWIVRLSARNSLSKDELFYFGVNERATIGFDNQFDNAKPPMLPYDSAVEIYYKRTNWHPLFTKYYSDIRRLVANQEMIWDFEFASRKSGSSYIEWKNLNTIFPPDYLEQYYFVLIDSTHNQIINMKSTTSYQFEHNGSITKFVIKVGKITSTENESNIKDYVLNQNYPNPFNPSTKISFAVKEKSMVNIKLFNLLGKEVALLINEEKEPGIYEVEVDANKLNLTSGIYFYKMTAGNFSSIRKMIYLK